MEDSKKRKFRYIPHSIAGKNACLMLLCGLAMLFFVLFLPSLFYKLTKVQLTEQMASRIREEAVRIGFLLTNHRPAGMLSENEEYMSLIEKYYDEMEDQDELRCEIEKELTFYEEGKKEWDEGTIGNTNYYFLVTDQGDMFCQPETLELAEHVMRSEWFLQKENIPPYSPVLTLRFKGEENQYFCYRRKFSAGEITGMIIHVALFSDYMVQLEKMQYGGVSDFIFVCGEEILYQNLTDSSLETVNLTEYMRGNAQYGVSIEETEDDFIFSALCSLRGEGLYLIVKMSRADIMDPFIMFFRIMQVCVIVIIFLMVMLSCGIVFFSLRRLSLLGQQMAQVGNGATKIHIRDNHEDEIGDIVRATHMMLGQIQKNTEERIQHEKEEKRMQYAMMISAMDPHFIYNTLDTVSFLAAMGRNDDVVKMNDSLIATLKDRLQMKAYKIFDTVLVELQVIENYMVIERYLFSDKITCEFQVEESVEHLLIPKNILQPLVENSIKHGFMTNKDDSGLEIQEGKVVISIHRKKEKLEIIVADNGNGMSEELKEYYLKESFQKEGNVEHVGLLNLKGRLEYLYHEDYSFDIESEPGQGMTICIIIPASDS